METFLWILFVFIFIAVYFLSAYVRYLYRLNRAKKKGQVISKERKHEIFFYYLRCYTSECPDKYESEDSLPTIPPAETSKKSYSRSYKSLSELEKENASEKFEKDEIITTAEAKKRISQLITDKNYVNINWISSVTLIPIEVVYELISQEESYQVDKDKVIQKKIMKGICPECSGQYSTYTEYCPNCGEKITRESVN